MALNITGLETGQADKNKLYHEIILGNNTVADNLINIIPGVKASKFTVPRMKGNVVLQAFSCNPSPSGSVSYSERQFEVAKLEIYDEFCLEDLKKTIVYDSKVAGTLNLDNPIFMAWLEEWVAKQFNAATHKGLWQGATTATKTLVAAASANPIDADYISPSVKATIAAMPTTEIDSFVADAIQYGLNNLSEKATFVAGTTLASANIVAEFDKISAAIPAAIVNTAEAMDKMYVFMPFSAKRFFDVANSSTTDYNRPFDYADNVYSRQGLKVKFVDLPANTAIAGIAGPDGNFILGTDLNSDWEGIVIDYAGKVGLKRLMFYNAAITMAIGVEVVNQVVIYG